jgi:ATP-dependent DNA helicase RecQ
VGCAVNVEELWRGARAEDEERVRRLLHGLRTLPLTAREGELAGTWRRRFAATGVTLTEADCLIAAAAHSAPGSRPGTPAISDPRARGRALAGRGLRTPPAGSDRALRQAVAVGEPEPVQIEAQIALRGLEGIEAPPDPGPRAYRGPRDPDALLAHLGYEGFRPGQREPVEAALAGRDSLVVMPTGGGKSLCYQLPGLAAEPLTIVVSPLIALMADQWRRLLDGGHPAVMIASGLPDDVARDAFARIRDGRARIAYCSPERFASDFFMGAIARRRVDLFVVDEAHCISEWGHDFRPDYMELPGVIERLGRPAVMACTATATPAVQAEITRRLGLRDPLVVRAGFDRPNLSFDVVRFEGRGSKGRKLALLRHGLADPANRPAIVYCGTRRDTEEVAAALRDGGLPAAGYHAGMEPDERASAQHRFMTGDAEVICATTAFGMGVDKADVRSVWHWAVPTSVEGYYQEAGRAGRDGLPSRAVLLAGRSDLGRLIRFIERNEADAAGQGGDPALVRERGWRAYRAIERFAFTDGCRRRRLLAHFGDRTPGTPAGRCCDVCDPDPWLPDPAGLEVRPPPRRSPKGAAAPAELSPEGAALYEELKAWRLRAAGGKPAYTVANNRTLEAIAAARPAGVDALAEIHGVGPAFISRHAEAVLALVARG